MGDRCSGHCCRRFWLPYSPAEIERYYEQETWGGWARHVPKGEMTKVRNMVVYLGPGSDGNELVDNKDLRPNKDGYYYTCVHHDQVTGNCNNYEDRPDMCRDYPFYGVGYSNKCRYVDCTWEEARNPPITTDNLLKRCGKASLEAALEGVPCLEERT